MSAAKPKDFKPWENELYEELEKEVSFQTYKKSLTTEFNYATDLGDILNEVTFNMLDHLEDREKFMEKIKETYGECPIEQHTTTFQEIARRGIDDKILTVISFVLSNNLIIKEVERVRVLKKQNKNKKKKSGANQYRSIVKERYIYDQAKLDDIIDGQTLEETDEIKFEKYILGTDEKKEEEEKEAVEREEAQYKKEEWVVKPHVRKLKDGRKVLVSGQKRKRRKELIKDLKEKTNANMKTYGMSRKDVEKIVKNTTEK